MRSIGLLVLLAALLAGCASSEAPPAESLPPGDAGRGGTLFTQALNGAPACSTCHALDGTTLAGPSLQGYASRAGTRVANISAEAYTYESIVRPTAYLVEGFGNAMYAQYARALTPQQFADLIAYLLTL